MTKPEGSCTAPRASSRAPRTLPPSTHTTRYPSPSDAIAGSAFRQAVAADAHFETGILPPNAIWCGVTPAGQRTMVFVPARTWKVKLKEQFGGPVEHFAVPMPDLVFMCLRGGQAPYAWAVRGRPARADATFFRLPAYNIFETGRILSLIHI